MKTKVQIQYVQKLNEERAKINLLDFDQIEWINEDGSVFEVSKSARKESACWDLSNTDFIGWNFKKENGVENETENDSSS